MVRKQDTRTVKAAGRKKSGKSEDKASEPAKTKASGKGKAAKVEAAKGKTKAPKIVTSRKPAPSAARTPVVSLATSPAGSKSELKLAHAQAKELIAEASVGRVPTSANMRILADDIAGMLDHPEGRARLAELLVYLAQHLTRP